MKLTSCVYVKSTTNFWVIYRLSVKLLDDVIEQRIKTRLAALTDGARAYDVWFESDLEICML